MAQIEDTLKAKPPEYASEVGQRASPALHTANKESHFKNIPFPLAFDPAVASAVRSVY